MKFDFLKLKKDIREIAVPIIAISLFIVIAEGRFGKICPLRMLIGIPCPTCGTTRAMALLLKGQIVQSTIMNPVWIPLLILVIMVLCYRYMKLSVVGKRRLKKIIKIVIILTIIFLMAYYIYRMIYWYPVRQPMVYDKNNLLNIVQTLYLQLSCQM